MQNPDEFDLPRRTGAVAGFLKSLDIPGRLKARGPAFTIVPVVLVAAIAGGVVWYSYPRGTAFQQDRPVPIIRADASPWKVVPQDPEGMDIPWRDSTVFDTLRGGGDDNVASSRVENLLPEAEKPLERAALFAGAETAEPAAPVITASAEPAKAEDITEDITADAAPVKTAPAPAAKPEPAVAAATPPQDEAAATAAKTEPAAGTATATTAATGDYFVQLGSLSSPDNAKQSWKTLQGLFPQQLEGLEMRVQEADLGAKGKFYRVQGGPVAETRAKAICEAVAAKRPGGCLVVHR